MTMSPTPPATGGDRDALDRLLATPEMSWFLQRVRDRLLTAGDGPLAGVVELRNPSPAQRAAATKLVGPRKRPGKTLRVDLADVETILRRGPWPPGLADAVVTLTGPVVDRAAERSSEAAQWESARSALTPVAHRFTGLLEWWESWCAAGGLKRAAYAEARRQGMARGPTLAGELVRQLSGVLEALPASGVPLAVFSRQVLGDAHGLDETRPLGRLAVAAVAAAFGPSGPAHPEVSRRDAWARAGVVMSNVASTALTLGVRGAVAEGTRGLQSATATTLEAMRAARAPAVLTLDQVRSGGVAPVAQAGIVHVCENPTVVEVAAQQWADVIAETDPSPTLVCTSGQPSTAVVELLEILTAGGAQCRYHGDFDWAGLRIARGLLARVAWTPWRFSAEDYRAAAATEASALGLVGDPIEAPWDPALSEEMVRTGRAVEEEAVVDVLVRDLVTRPDGLPS